MPWRCNKCIRLQEVVQVEIRLVTQLLVFVIFLFTSEGAAGAMKKGHSEVALGSLMYQIRSDRHGNAGDHQ
jgi:hypothetical protein